MSVELRLTREERSRVFAGNLNVIRRPVRPYPLAAGQKYVVASTRRQVQIVDRETGATVEIPAVPNLWITVKGWTLKEGEWEITVAIHDERQPVRRLAMGAPSAGGKSGGLNTRAGTKVTHRDGGVAVVDKRVPKKGEEQEHWTREAERGYGGTDGEEAVDDATLSDFAARVQMRNARAQQQRREDERRSSAATALAADRAAGKPTDLATARVQRAEKAARKSAHRQAVAA